MKSLRIGERTIGPDHPVLVVAEIGVNHDGAIEQAIQLARIAGDCGADAVKFQVFRASALMHTSCAPAEYQKHQCAGDDASSMLRRYELSAKEIRFVAEDQLSITVGKASIVMEKNGDVVIKGGEVELTGSGNVIVKGSKVAQN